MKKSLQILILFISIFSCKSQNQRIENKIIKCFNNVKFVNEIYDFEKELIAQNVLKNSNGKSYIELLEEIKKGKKLVFDLSEIKKEIHLSSKISNCQQNILRSEEFKNSKAFKIKQQFEKNLKEGKFTVPNNIEIMLEVLKAPDFNLPYYKLMTYRILEFHNSEIGIENKFPKTRIECKILKQQSKSSIEVFINNENEIFVNGKIKTENELKTEIYNYEKKNKNNSVIFIKSNRNTLYKVYSNVTNLIDFEINRLRNEYSIEFFNKEYDILSKENKQIIKKKYPKKIIETEPVD